MAPSRQAMLYAFAPRGRLCPVWACSSLIWPNGYYTIHTTPHTQKLLDKTSKHLRMSPARPKNNLLVAFNLQITEFSTTFHQPADELVILCVARGNARVGT